MKMQFAVATVLMILGAITFTSSGFAYGEYEQVTFTYQKAVRSANGGTDLAMEEMVIVVEGFETRAVSKNDVNLLVYNYAAEMLNTLPEINAEVLVAFEKAGATKAEIREIAINHNGIIAILIGLMTEAKNAMDTDGIVGPETLGAMNSVYNKTSKIINVIDEVK